MKISVILFMFNTFLVLSSCNKKIEPDLEFKDYYAEGTADSNHLEKGEWKFFDLQTKNLVQVGNFELGVRKGTWQYLHPALDSIVWNPYFDSTNQIFTNLPKFLKVESREKGFVSFKHLDPSKFMVLKIGYSSSIPSDADEYRKIIRKEIDKNSREISLERSKIIKTTCNNVYYLHQLRGIDLKNLEYELRTINAKKDSLFIEVTMRVGLQDAVRGEIIFNSVVSNLFLMENRFFDSHIDCEIVLNKIKKKRGFLIGCN